ncbi:MAG TPA: hypothetical protein VMZ00_09250 [Sporichthya sp.]|nr:hypothetical protein [Sporichthya sp.]
MRMQPTVSTVPACLDALVAAAGRALPGVQVFDGQPSKDIDDDLVLIGFTGEPGEAAVTSTRVQQQAATAPDRESYDVTCLASSWHGHDDDPASVRNRAYELVNLLAAELASDPTLGGTVGRSRISTNAFAQAQTERGATAVVRFVVHVEAFTR